MFNSSVLDVAIGLAFVYLILALLCTALNEWWARQLKLRGKVLQEGIHSLLAAGPEGNALTKAFYNSPLIKSITGPGGHPSYFSPQMFALALTDALKTLKAPTAPTAPAAPGADVASVQALVAQIADGPAKTALQTVLMGAEPTLDAGLKRISKWFEDSMDRVSGWYKRKIQLVTLIMGILVTLFTNADTLQIVNRLWTSPTVRAAVVAHAQERLKQPPPVSIKYADSSPIATPPSSTSSSTTDESGNTITAAEKETIGELMSWSPELTEFNKRAAEKDPALKADIGSELHFWNMVTHPGVFFSWLYWLIPSRIIGWIITVYAISLGAPFWFGLLQKLVNIRSTGTAPDEKKNAPSNA